MEQTPYLSAQQVAELEDCNRTWIQFLCREGRIPGAFKAGATWVIPNPYVIEPPPSQREAGILTTTEIAPYLSIQQVAELEDCNREWIQFLCREGRIPGAFKAGATWVIPNPYVIEPPSPWEAGFLTVGEVAKKLAISDKRVIKLCVDGKIQGAKRIGRLWAIPSPIVRIAGTSGRQSKQDPSGGPSG